MATKYTNRMVATVWMPHMKAEIVGTPDSVIVSAFRALGTTERRAAVLKEMNAMDARMTALEAQRAEAAK